MGLCWVLSKHKRLGGCRQQSEGLVQGCRRLLQWLEASTATALSSGWKTGTKTRSGKKQGCFPASPPSAAQPQHRFLNYIF